MRFKLGVLTKYYFFEKQNLIQQKKKIAHSFQRIPKQAHHIHSQLFFSQVLKHQQAGRRDG